MPGAAQAPISRRERMVFAAVAVIIALLAAWMLVERPGFTDAFYHFNAAHRLVVGYGLTDAYLWNYIYLPETLPLPSHLYWMPLTSLVSAAGMWFLNAPGSYVAAQIPLVLLTTVTAYTAFWLGERLGGSRRHAWAAGLVTLSGGYYLRYWGVTDTFAPYAAVGSLALVFMGLGAENGQLRWFALAGVMAALGHLTRADGLLLLVVGWAVIVWMRKPARNMVASLSAMTGMYLLVMMPWFVRNTALVDTPLPVGGAQAMWFTSYDDIFSYPVQSAIPALLGDDGTLGALIAARGQAISEGLGTFIAVEGFVVLTPLMLLSLWLRRRSSFLRAFWLYALGMHLAMTLLFPFPGMRGGLFHSAVALVPWWAALGIVGLDDAVEWVAKRRRTWRPAVAKRVFTGALVVFVMFISVALALPRRVTAVTPAFYPYLAGLLPADARVMINDPAQLYYYTGLGGVVIPNADPVVILEIARRYNVDYLLIEEVTADGSAAQGAPTTFWPLLTDPPAFLEPVPLDDYSDKRLYAIHHDPR